MIITYDITNIYQEPNKLDYLTLTLTELTLKPL